VNRYRNTTDFLDDPVLERDDHGDVILAADFEAYQRNLHEALADFEKTTSIPAYEAIPLIRAIQGIYKHHAPCERCRKFTELDGDGLCDNHQPEEGTNI
jgi:hypothetical protein